MTNFSFSLEYISIYFDMNFYYSRYVLGYTKKYIEIYKVFF